MKEVNLELMPNFEDVIISHTAFTELDHLTNTVKVKFRLMPDYIGIGSYLKEQCFCHTDKKPLVEFNYNDGYSGFARYAVPEDNIKFYDYFVILTVHYSNWLDMKSARFGGMYG